MRGGGALRAPAFDRSGRLQIALVANRTAGSFSRGGFEKLCHALQDDGCSLQRYDSAAFRPDQLAGEVDLICIAGGDGTIRTTIGNDRGDQHRTPYCVFPMGTINLVARETGCRPSHRRFSPDLLSRAPQRTVFAGRAGNEAFLCCASVSPDSHAVATISPTLKKKIGRFAYVVATLKLLRDWPRHQLDVRIDGASHRAEAVYVLKGRYYAGPWMLDEKASLSSDRFRVLLMPKARRRDFARLSLYALFGQPFADPSWVRADARTVEIDSAGPAPVQADGDFVATTPAQLSIDPRPLTFLCGFNSSISSYEGRGDRSVPWGRG